MESSESKARPETLTFEWEHSGGRPPEEKMGKVEVLIPTGEVEAREIEMAKKPAGLRGKTVGFFWNRKPNGDLLLKKLEDELVKRLQLRRTLTKQKGLSSSGAPPEILDELSSNCDMVLLAVGD